MKKNPFEKFLRPEDHLHIQICRYIRLAYPKAAIHHSPNEGKRSAFERYLLSLMGVSSGFPDLIIINDGIMIGLELKSGKNKPTENQLYWIVVLSTICPTTWVNNFDDGVAFIDNSFKKKAPMKP